MCFSAQCWADYQRYVREFGADIDIHAFARLYGLDQLRSTKRPKAMDAAFRDPENDSGRTIKRAIDAFNADQARILEQEVFAQESRLAEAERSLQTKPTKAAAASQRIAASKIERALARIADLKRLELKDRDSRMFPGYFVPVMVSENGRYLVKPMRYQCRLAGKPAFYDRKYPGTYNARRDNLEGFWRHQFGRTHGLMGVNRFYENVCRHTLEHRVLSPEEKEENLVLEFSPQPAHDMLVACLWSRWEGPGGEELLSFAAITDAPPPEVAAAGHDRCIIPIKREHVETWLNPDAADLKSSYEILDDRDRPYYEHRVAA